MRCPTLADLPAPPAGKTGWPWTTDTPQLPDRQTNGQSWPRISIVTPSYNQGQYIEETIRSVLLQGYPDLEYVVMDGGSTDESVEIIKRYAAWLTHWESTPDRGQAHAINKGWNIASGSTIQWINSDDRLLPNCLAYVGTHCPRNGMLATAVEVFGPEGESTVRENIGLCLRAMLDQEVQFSQPGLWISSEAARSCFPLDEALHYAFDWKMVWDLVIVEAPCIESKVVLSSFRKHPTSKTISQGEKWISEGATIYKYLLSDAKFSHVSSIIRPVARRAAAIEAFDAARDGPAYQLLAAYLRLFALWPSPIASRYILGGLRQAMAKKCREVLPHR